MVIKNSSNFGSSLTSLGDGSDASFWRQGGAWDSGTPSNTGKSVTTNYTNLGALTSIATYTGPNTAPAGFLRYLILFNFGETSSLPSADTQVYAALSLNPDPTLTPSPLIMDYQIGFTKATQAASFSSSFIYNAPDTQPFSLYLFAKTGGSASMTVAYAHITVIGIN